MRETLALILIIIALGLARETGAQDPAPPEGVAPVGSVTPRGRDPFGTTTRMMERAAAAGPVRVKRSAWMDVAATLAAADPVRDLATPLKGPYETVALGDLADAAGAAIRLAKLAGLLPALYLIEGRTDQSGWPSIRRQSLPTARRAS